MPARPSADAGLRRTFLAAGFAAAALTLAAGLAPAGAADPPPDAHAAPNGSVPSGAQYFKLDPFIVPVMSRTAVVRHLTFIVTLELASVDMRTRVQQRLPILRHALNTALLQLVGVERADGTLPPISAVKERMLQVTREVTGPDTVRALLMELVYERRLR